MIFRSELDEKLMHENLLKCYGASPTGFHVSTDHYRYLAEQVISLREEAKRDARAHQEEIRDTVRSAQDEATWQRIQGDEYGSF
jgi:hypothetical protein